MTHPAEQREQAATAQYKHQYKQENKASFFDVFLGRGATADRIARIEKAMRATAFAQIVSVLACVLALQDNVAEPLMLIVWVGFTLALSTPAIWRGAGSHHAVLSTKPFVIARAILVALPWSFFTIYCQNYVPEIYQPVPFAVTAGMVAGGAVMLSPIPVICFGYMISILAPLVITCLISEIPHGWLLAACIAVFAANLMLFSMGHSRLLTEAEQAARAMRAHMDDLTRAHHEIEQMAQSDIVTSLPNRRAFATHLQKALDAMPDISHHVLPVFLIDLDHFKAVNDLHGHDTGDVYLREIATRMAASVPEGWVVSRLGGDEFAVCGNTTVPLSLAIQTGHRLIERIAEPLVIGTDTFRPGCSIGLSYGPHHATSGRDLMAYADHALLAAKATGRGKLGLFDAAGKQAIADAAKEGRLLSEALASDTVFMQYQPQIDMSTGRVVGAEALVRWQHPQGHVVQPMQLFGLAEDSGLLSILCKHILKRLAADMHALHTEFGCLPRIGLNLHPTQIKNLFSLLQELEVVASPSGDNGHLVLEISENALVGRGTEDIPLVLSGLRDMGFELSLDDFGTGLASLTHLRDLPFTEVKLSQSVIARLPDDGEEYAMVEGIYDLARKKGMRVVAEGVETARQEQLLNKLGPMTAQGFYYHAPMSCSAFAIFLSSAKLSVSVRPTLLDSPVSETGYFESFSTKDAA